MSPSPVDRLTTYASASICPASRGVVEVGGVGRVSAEWLAGQAEKLSAADAQFARGMAALLREGRRLTPRQIGRLRLLTAALI